MREPVIVVGLGEMGGVFSHALLRAGHPIVPVLRRTRWDEVTEGAPHAALVLVAVAEQALHPVLDSIPAGLRDRVGLLQNELLPREWERHGIESPTVMAVWFEKKKTTAVHVIRPTAVAGPAARQLVEALEGLDIAAEEVEAGDPLAHALATKNVYILTTNLAGLEVGGTVGALWGDHRDLAEAVAGEVFDLQERLLGRSLPRDEIFAEVVDAFLSDPEHGCKGRSAPARLRRALEHADELGLGVPRLRSLARHLESAGLG